MKTSTTTSRLPAFTLVETLVAISVLLIAIVGPFYAIQKSITASFVARDQLTASALSQEGLEYVYALRDNNYLQRQLGSNPSFLAGLDNTSNVRGDSANCFMANGCTLDPAVVPGLVACSTNCTPLTLYTGSPVRYSQDSTNPVTKFTRKITATSITSYEVQVIVLVSWITLGTPYSVTTTEDFYNWQ